MFSRYRHLCSHDGRDLDAVATDIQKIIDSTQAEWPNKKKAPVLRGQIETMRTAYSQLVAGLALSIVLVYLLIVVNFQSWLDPFVIVSALPAALAGIVWMLFTTHTTLSVPALDRRDHVHWRGDRQFQFGGQLCPRPSGGRRGCHDGSPGCRLHALQAGPDDRACHDHRHAAHGDQRRAECAARSRRGGRPHMFDAGYAAVCPGNVCPRSRAPRPASDFAFAGYANGFNESAFAATNRSSLIVLRHFRHGLFLQDVDGGRIAMRVKMSNSVRLQ